MKVLLSAFSCGPGRGSDPGVGWNWVRQISRHHKVWLITTDEFQVGIQAAALANVHSTFLPSYRTWAWLKGWPIPGLDWVYYYWWQWKAYRVARRLQAQIGFDLAHNVTFASWRAPSFLCLLPIPLIWGPVGGGGTIPPRLRGQLGWKGRLFEDFRHLAQQVSRFDPFVRLTMKRAAAIVAANYETANLVPESLRSKTSIMATGGMSSSEMVEAVPPKEPPKGFVILFVALLRPLKGGALAVRAIQRLAQLRKDATLMVIGSGSEGDRLAALAAELGVADQVRFLGGLSRPDVLGWMQSADALLFPSLRDSGPLVVLEAMVAGKPVVCLDLGGPGYFVTDECGIKVKPGDPGQVVADLAAALDKLAGNPDLRRAMGQAGRRRVEEHFSWDKRGELMLDIYRRVTEANVGPAAR